MSKTILVTRPEYDPTTRYLSFWSQSVITQAKKSTCKVVDLAHDRANRREFNSVIKKTKPNIVFLNGHGGPDAIYGQDEDVLVKSGDNEELLSDKTVYAVSCQSAKHLGPQSIKSGSRAYIGYDEDFIFYREVDKLSRPLEDKTAAYFFLASNQVSYSLIKGRAPRESYLNSQTVYKRTMRQLLSSSSTSQSHLLRFLVWDMQHQVCLEPPQI